MTNGYVSKPERDVRPKGMVERVFYPIGKVALLSGGGLLLVLRISPHHFQRRSTRRRVCSSIYFFIFFLINNIPLPLIHLLPLPPSEFTVVFVVIIMYRHTAAVRAVVDHEPSACACIYIYRMPTRTSFVVVSGEEG